MFGQVSSNKTARHNRNREVPYELQDKVPTSHFVSFCITFESKSYKAMALYPNEFFGRKIGCLSIGAPFKINLCCFNSFVALCWYPRSTSSRQALKIPFLQVKGTSLTTDIVELRQLQPKKDVLDKVSKAILCDVIKSCEESIFVLITFIQDCSLKVLT